MLTARKPLRRSLRTGIVGAAVLAAGMAVTACLPVSPQPTGVGASWPTATTTGVPAGTGLSGWTWALRTSAAPAPTTTINGMTCKVFDGFNIVLSGSQQLSIDSPCVVFRRTKFTTTGVVSGAMVMQGKANKYMEFSKSEFDGGPSFQRGLLVFYADAVVKSSKFTRFGEAGVELENSTGTASLTVQDSYFYEAPGWPKADHVDGIQVGTGKNVTIRHNTILVSAWGGATGDISHGSNSALGLWAELGNVTGTVVVDNNVLAGGSYSIYAEQKSPYTWQGPVSITNNVFDQQFSSLGGIWGVLYPNRLPAQFTWSGNRFSSGVAISLAQAMAMT
jgi:hypothetical protein